MSLYVILIGSIFPMEKFWKDFFPLLEWQDEQVTNVTKGATLAIRGTTPRDLCVSFIVLFLWDIS